MYAIRSYYGSPYRAELVHSNHSFGKSYTATAISIAIQEGKLHRITSYNVCYTKLLRIAMRTLMFGTAFALIIPFICDCRNAALFITSLR